MVIVCAVSDGYYLPAPLALLYASCLLPPFPPSLSPSYSHYMLLALAAFPLLCVILLPSALSRSLTFPYHSIGLFAFSVFGSLMSICRVQAFPATQAQQFSL